MFVCIESRRWGTEEHLRGNYGRNNPGDWRLMIPDGGFHSNKEGKSSSKHSQTPGLVFCFFFLPLCVSWSLLQARVQPSVNNLSCVLCLGRGKRGGACDWTDTFFCFVLFLISVKHVVGCRLSHSCVNLCVCVLRGISGECCWGVTHSTIDFFLCVFHPWGSSPNESWIRSSRLKFCRWLHLSYSVCWMCGGATGVHDSWTLAGRLSGPDWTKAHRPQFGIWLDILQRFDQQSRLQQEEMWRLLTVLLLSAVINRNADFKKHWEGNI